MKRLFILHIAFLVFLIGNPSISADWEKGWDAYDNEDYETAYREFTTLAEQGNAKAQHALGVLYLKGQGVQRSEKTAVKWITLAALGYEVFDRFRDAAPGFTKPLICPHERYHFLS